MGLDVILCKNNKLIIKDTIALISLSFYSQNPIKKYEVYTCNTLMSIIQITPVLFFILLMSFIYTLKYDLNFLNINFNIKENDFEFSIDIEANNKAEL